MPITILCVEKTGTIKEIELKTYNETDLFKKAGFKTAQDFELQTEWGAEINGKAYSVSVFGKANGRAGQENKYDFPPPIDTTLLFGSCLLVNKVDGVPTNLSKGEWKLIYEHLFGGFEDIGDEDSEESEDDLSDSVPRTKEGYVKDGFIVDDDDEDDEDYEDNESDYVSTEEEVIVKKKQTKKTEIKTAKPTTKTAEKKTSTKKNSEKSEKPVKNVFTKMQEEPDIYLDCTSELSEEDYV
jgi:hypothetical protein